MHKIDILIFDLDGTLVDSRQDIVNAVNFTLRELKLKEKPFAQIVSLIGTGVRSLMAKAIGPDNQALRDKGVKIFEEYYKVHAAENTRLYPNVEEILEYFDKKIKLIITNRSKEMAKLTLAGLGIEKYFKGIVGGDDENCLKPSACPLDKGLAGFNYSKGTTMIIGDMDLDVVAGKNSGIRTCAVTYGIGKKEDIIKAGPDYIIDDIIELKNICK